MAINQQLITLKYIHLITSEWDDCLFWILNKEQCFEVVQGSFSKPFQPAPVTAGPVAWGVDTGVNGHVDIPFTHGKNQSYQFYCSDAQEHQCRIAVIMCSVLYK